MNEQMENNVLETTEKPSLLGMITSPGEQFERIKDNPRIIVALLVITALAIVSALLTLKGMDAMMEEQFAEFGEEEMFMFTIVTQITTVVFAAIGPAAIILISAAIYLVIAKIAQSDVTFKQLFSMFTYLSIITILGGLLNGIMLALVGGNPETSFTSLNSIVGAEGVLGVILNSIEVFMIWGLILTAIGLQIVADFSKKLAWGVVIAFALLGLGIGIVAVVIGQSFGV